MHLVWLLACGASGLAPTEVPVKPPSDPGPGEAVRPADSSDPLNEALQAIFDDAPPCLGAFSRVEVWRNPAGEVHRFYYHGDLTACSHPPSVYYDAKGQRLEVVPLEPLTDDNRAHYAELHARHKTDAKKAESRGF